MILKGKEARMIASNQPLPPEHNMYRTILVLHSIEGILDGFPDQRLERIFLEELAHRIVRDDTDKVNGHVRHYRIVQYDREGLAPLFWHFACMFDQESGKAVIVSGYFPDKDAPEIAKLLKSVRFKK